VRVTCTDPSIVVEGNRKDGNEYEKEYRNTNLSLVLCDSLKTFLIYRFFHGLILHYIYRYTDLVVFAYERSSMPSIPMLVTQRLP